MAEDIERRAHALFVQSLDLDGARRDAFVAANCRADPALERRVRRLIAAVERSTTFLETPALAARSAPNGGSPRPDPASITVRGYRVIRAIGAGGMATVYEALQEQPERTVALKVMNRSLANTSAVRRFKYETEVLARLQHPGIAQIFEAGTCDDGHGNTLPFFAMEYVVGARTITDHARTHARSLNERLAMFARVCDAVQHGHQLGVIHRDLKPANILVDDAGKTKIIDFGVARSTNADHHGLTRAADAGQLIGTLNSMSPEQCSGTAEVDARTDVYSLGVLLYQLVAGRLPHDLSRASIPEAVRIITQDPPVRLGALVPEARGDLEAMASMAMEKLPSRRYPSAGALAADVRRYLNHQTIDARPPTVLHQLELFSKRHRVLVGAGLAVLFVLLAASALIAIFAFQTAVESKRRFDAEQTALKERDVAVRQAYIASVAGSLSSAQLGDLAQARRRLDQAPPSQRNWEWSLISSLIERGERTIRAHNDMVFALAASPDARTLATGSRDGSIALWEAATGRRILATQGASSPILAIAFTRDGNRLIVGTEDADVHVLDARTGVPLFTLGRMDSPVESISCSPDGRIAAASRNGQATLWNADNTDPPVTIDDHPEGIHGVAFSPDGSMLLTWSKSGSLHIRHAEDSRVLHPLTFGSNIASAVFSPDGSLIAAAGVSRIKVWRADDASEGPEFSISPSITTVRSLAFSPDSRRLASGQADRIIRLWSLQSRTLEDTRVGHHEAVSGLVFAADGDGFHSASWDGTIRSWPIGSATPRGPLRLLKGHNAHVLSAAFSPDGRLIASAARDNTIRLWDPVFGEVLAVLTGHEASVTSVAFSPDGTRLASASEDGSVRLWSTHTGSHTHTLEPTGAPIRSVTFSPDGTRVAAADTNGYVRAWNTTTRQCTLDFQAHTMPINAVRYSPDSTLLATASRDTTVGIWNAQTAKRQFRLVGHQLDVFSLAFSHDGNKLYSGSRDQTVRIWNPHNGAFLEALDSHGQFITSLSISPDGTRLAAGSWFAEIVLWDLNTNDLVASFKGHNSAIRSIAFSPDGVSLLCGGHDGTLTNYNVTPRSNQEHLFERTRNAIATAQRAIDLLAASHQTPAQLLDALDKLLQDDYEAGKWAKNLVLKRCATPIEPTLPDAPTSPGTPPTADTGG